MNPSISDGIESCNNPCDDATGLSELEGLQSLLNATSSTPISTSNDHPFRVPHPPTISRASKLGVSASGRSPLSAPGGLRGPPGVVPPSALYTAVISPSEMAAHEATNFKNVKGVYKNCRGIWAAQWTDERGQRHTKYFNPKYYATESVRR